MLSGLKGALAVRTGLHAGILTSFDLTCWDLSHDETDQHPPLRSAVQLDVLTDCLAPFPKDAASELRT